MKSFIIWLLVWVSIFVVFILGAVATQGDGHRKLIEQGETNFWIHKNYRVRILEEMK